jgi:hypothetical protein
MLRVLCSCAHGDVGRFPQRFVFRAGEKLNRSEQIGVNSKNIMILTSAMKFNTGNLVITPAALEAIPADDILRALDRHIVGDCGDVTPADRDENNFSLREGLRILSAYHTAAGVKFWIITEADRSATTVLLPSDY